MAVNLDRTHYALISASIILAAVIVLMYLGRTPWGAASGPGLWTSATHSRLTSQLLADPYTLTHVSHGLVFCMLLAWLIGDYTAVGTRLVVAVALEAGWEIVENTPPVIERFREVTIGIGYYGDSILNSVGDILAMIVGFAIAARLSDKWTIGVFLALEFVLIFWIRDSLLLTIVMLVYPLPGIRNWQAAG